jgi:hypothetical protein
VALGADPLAIDRFDDISALTEQMRIPGTLEVQLPSHADFHYIPSGYVKPHTVPRDIEKIDLDFPAVSGEEHDLAALLLPFDYPPVEQAAG